MAAPDRVARHRAGTAAPTVARALVAALALSAALASCSADDPATGDPVAAELGPVDPCSLLSPSEIRSVTGWTVPDGVDESELLDGTEVAVCSFTEPDHVGVVQVQLDEGAGRAEFERRRAELEGDGMDGRDARVSGAERAYEAPEHGVVGMLVDDTFVQVVTIGPGVDEGDHLRLAATVAGHL